MQNYLGFLFCFFGVGWFGFFLCVGFGFLFASFLFGWVLKKKKIVDVVVKVATRILLQPQTLFFLRKTCRLALRLRHGCCLKAAQERGAIAWRGRAPALGKTGCWLNVQGFGSLRRALWDFHPVFCSSAQGLRCLTQTLPLSG